MNPNNHDQLKKLVCSIQGLTCWYVSCGGAAGPTFELALGQKVPRQMPLKNPAHSEEFRCYEGEANLLVWCSWRLDGPDRPLTSSDDSLETIEKELPCLVGARIESITLIAPAWDLIVRFSNGLNLHVFADHVPGDPSFDGNWDLSLQKVAVSAGPGADYAIEERDGHNGGVNRTAQSSQSVTGLAQENPER